MKLTKRAMIIPAASLLLLGGCAKPSAYKDPISKFQSASTVVLEGARSEYYAINKRERDYLIDKSVAEGKDINVILLDKTYLLKKEDIDARITALNVLKKHGELLFKLASSSAPDEAKQAANSFDEAILKLSQSLGKVSPDEGFKDKAGAVATIAGQVIKLVLDTQIEQALKKAVALSENDVSSLIALIEKEMVVFRINQKSFILPNARLLAVNEYNQELKKANHDPEKLKKVAARIKDTEDAWEKLLFLPDPGFREMNDAHKKLVQYAKKEKKSSKDLAELVAAMDTFADQAKIIADAIKTLQQ